MTLFRRLALALCLLPFVASLAVGLARAQTAPRQLAQAAPQAGAPAQPGVQAPAGQPGAQAPGRPGPAPVPAPMVVPQVNVPLDTSPQPRTQAPPPAMNQGPAQPDAAMPPVILPPALPPTDARKPAAEVSPREALLPCVLAKVLAGITCKSPDEFQFMGPRGDALIFNGFYGAHFTEYYCQVYPDDTLLVTSPAFGKAVYGGKLFFDEARLCLSAEIKNFNCTSAPRQRCCIGPDPEAPRVKQPSTKAKPSKRQ